MNESTRRILYWTPRILGLVFAAFLSIFALDVFNEADGFLETTVALLMHLVPTYLALIFVLLAWRREWVGGIAFTGLGVLYVASSWGRFPLSTYFVIAGPLVIIGALFFLNWFNRDEMKRA